jgi:hypothetical protein
MISIPKYLKQILILIIIFLVIYWFQNVDNKNNLKENENTKSIYFKLKLPLLVTSVCGILMLGANTLLSDNINSGNSIKADILNHSFDTANKVNTMKSVVPELNVYTEQPEW